MTKCPMCQEWIRAEDELCCERCKPALEVDLAVADLEKSVHTLESHAPIELRCRIRILARLSVRLEDLIVRAS